MRLFLLSFVALAMRSLGRARNAPALAPGVFWSANLLTAVAFGLGHLPLTARLVPLTPVVVERAVALNCVVGVVAGALYWREGIEMAMLCHFSADLVLHVVAPLLQPWILQLAA